MSSVDSVPVVTLATVVHADQEFPAASVPVSKESNVTTPSTGSNAVLVLPVITAMVNAAKGDGDVIAVLAIQVRDPDLERYEPPIN